MVLYERHAEQHDLRARRIPASGARRVSSGFVTPEGLGNVVVLLTATTRQPDQSQDSEDHESRMSLARRAAIAHACLLTLGVNSAGSGRGIDSHHSRGQWPSALLRAQLAAANATPEADVITLRGGRDHPPHKSVAADHATSLDRR